MDKLKKIEKGAINTVTNIIKGREIANSHLMLIAGNTLKQDLVVSDAYQVVLVMAAFN